MMSSEPSGERENTDDSDNVGIVIVVQDPAQLNTLFATGMKLATARDEKLALLVFSEDGNRPDWFEAPEGVDAAGFEAFFLLEEDAIKQVEDWLETHQPVLMGFAFDLIDSQGRHTLDKQLDALLTKITCPVALISSDPRLVVDMARPTRVLVPFSTDANSIFAIKTALEISPSTELVVIGFGPTPADEADKIARKEIFTQSLGEYANHPLVTTHLLLGDNAVKRLIKGVSAYDVVLLGASRGNTFVRAMLGDHIGIGISEAGQRIVKETELPYIVVREYQGWLGSRLALAVLHGEALLPKVTDSERIEIYKEVRRAARPQIDFFVMTALSAAIASFGLILDSAAVIIGAMLIAPLMSAIIGMGLAMVQGDARFLFTSAGAVGRGALVVVLVGIVIGWLDVSNQLTAEILARSGPNLFDLGVATLSGAAAAYALCRKGVSSSLPGVAISVALVPPLASLGLFISYAQWAYAYGALLLFVTNMTAISFSCGIVFTLVGFRPAEFSDQSLSRVLTFKRSFFVLGLAILAVASNLMFLSFERQQEEHYIRDVRATVEHYFRDDINRDMFLVDIKVDEKGALLDEILATVSSSPSISETEIIILADKIAVLRNKSVQLSVISAPLIRGHSTLKLTQETEE